MVDIVDIECQQVQDPESGKGKKRDDRIPCEESF